MMSPETLAGMLDEEIERAIDRLTQARRDIENDLAALQNERDRRERERRHRLDYDITGSFPDEEFDA
jgi:hypothetical protein